VGIEATGSVTIEGNYVGNHATGNAALGNGSNNSGGAGIIDVDQTHAQSVTTIISNNLVSGNNTGIVVNMTTVSQTSFTIANNLIGTNAAGTSALGNTGVDLNLSARNATVENNVVSANSRGIVVGRIVPLLNSSVDARWLIAAGLLVMAAGCFWMARMNLYISPGQVVWPRVVLIVGLSLLFSPINVAAFRYTPPHLRAAAVGLFALRRNEGGSVGMSVAKIIEERCEQFHLARVGEHLSPLNPHVQSFFSRGQAYFLQQTGAIRPGRRGCPFSRSRTSVSSRRRPWPTLTSSGCSPP
jgi:hypothetical protein